MLLSGFESGFGPTILQRGKNYFKQGAVFELNEMSKGVWLARVAGTDEYEVNIKLSGDEVISSTCACPYFDESDCKHIVASLFAIRAQEGDILMIPATPKKKGKSTAPPKPAKMTIAEKFALIRDKVDPEELLDMLLEHALSNNVLMNALIIRYAYLFEEQTEIYDEMMKAGIRNAKGRYGFIEYNKARSAVEVPEMLLAKSDTLINQGNTDEALTIFTAIIFNLSEALEQADDSSGIISDCLNRALSALDELLQQESTPVVTKTNAYNILFAALQKNTRGASDIHFSLVELVIAACTTPDQFRSVDEWLDERIKKYSTKGSGDSFYDNYTTEQYIRFKINITRLTGKKEHIQALLHQYVRFSSIREELIEQYILENNYSEAEHLCHEGIQQDRKNAPGYMRKWADHLVNIYRLSGDQDKYLASLFNQTLYSYSLNNYTTLIEAHPEKEAIRSKIIETLIARKNYDSTDFLMSIYDYERMHTKLIDLIKSKGSFNHIEHYSSILLKHEPEYFLSVYFKQIDYCLKEAGRSHYKEVVRLLRRLKKYGFETEVLKHKNHLLETYPKRPALRDELMRV